MDADWPVEGRGPQGADGSRGCVLALSSCPVSVREREHPWIGVRVERQHVADGCYILFPSTKCPFSKLMGQQVCPSFRISKSPAPKSQ